MRINYTLFNGDSIFNMATIAAILFLLKQSNLRVVIAVDMAIVAHGRPISEVVPSCPNYIIH